MMNLRFKSVLLACILIHAFALSQDKEGFETNYIMGEGEVALQEEAEWLLSYGKYDKALESFLKLDQRYPFNEVYKYYAGICFLEKPDQQEKAIDYLEQAYQKNPNLENIQFLLGKAYFLNYRFDEAVGNLKLASQSKNTSKSYRKEIDNILASCKNGKELIRNAETGNINIVNLGAQLNSADDEFLPLLTGEDNKIIYSYRGKKSRGGLQNIYGEPDPDGSYNNDIFSAEFTNNSWGTPKDLGGRLNTNQSEIATAISFNGEELFITKPDNGGDLYSCQRSKNSWLAPIPLQGDINTKHFEGHATITPDGKTIYFVSDRPEGYGGMDIYSATLNEENTWTNITNLGPEINTESNEDSPFLHPSGSVLFFSSKGHKTMGGYDIFYSNKKRGTWSSPKNLGYPINTTNDDKYYLATNDGKQGYLSSERKGGNGGDDIYLVEPGIPDEAPILMQITGTITFNGKPKQSNIKVTNILSGKVIGMYTSGKSTGKYVAFLPAGYEYELDFMVKEESMHKEIINLEDLFGFTLLNQDFELSAKRNPSISSTDILQLQLDELTLMEPDGSLEEEQGLASGSTQNNNSPNSIELIRVTNEQNTSLNKQYLNNQAGFEEIAWQPDLLKEDAVGTAESLLEESKILYEQGQAMSVAAQTIGDSQIKQKELLTANSILTQAIIKQEEGSNKLQYILNNALFLKECKIGPGIKDYELEEVKRLQKKAVEFYEKAQELRNSSPDSVATISKELAQANMLEKLAIEKLVHSINQCKFHKNEAILASLAKDNGFHDKLSLDSLINLQNNFNQTRDSLAGLWERSEFIKNDSVRLVAFHRGNSLGKRLLRDQLLAIEIYNGIELEEEGEPITPEEPIIEAETTPEPSDTTQQDTLPIEIRETDEIPMEDTLKPMISDTLITDTSMDIEKDTLIKVDSIIEEVTDTILSDSIAQKPEAEDSTSAPIADTASMALAEIPILEEPIITLEDVVIPDTTSEEEMTVESVQEDSVPLISEYAEPIKEKAEEILEDSVFDAMVLPVTIDEATEKIVEEPEPTPAEETIIEPATEITLEEPEPVIAEEIKPEVTTEELVEVPLEKDTIITMASENILPEEDVEPVKEEPEEKLAPTEITETPAPAYENILFDFDKYELRPLSKQELDQIAEYLSANSMNKIEMAGHADAIGSESYNMVLSEKRAREAGGYLVNKGVKKEQIRLYAFGEGDPLLPNTNPDGKDSPENRQKNRRVAFSSTNAFSENNPDRAITLSAPVNSATSQSQTIYYKVQIAAYRYPKNYDHSNTDELGNPNQLDIKGITRFTIGKFTSLKEARDMKALLVKKGVEDAFITAELNGERKYLFELSEMNLK